MSLLASPARYSRSTSAPVASLIGWNEVQPSLWVGKIDLDYAGLVELRDGRFVVTDWKNDTVGEFRSLSDAQRSLEPSHRMAERDRAERAAERTSWIVAGAATLSAAVLVTTLSNWLLAAV